MIGLYEEAIGLNLRFTYLYRPNVYPYMVLYWVYIGTIAIYSQ